MVETIGNATLYLGDCLEILPTLDQVDVVVTDPPYGTTSLAWDTKVDGWLDLLKSNCLWCCGSMQFFMNHDFQGWRHAQEIVWEKHNGSNFHADRFRRVHELILQFYKGDWNSIYKSPVVTQDATARTVRRKHKPAHTRQIHNSSYTSADGGPRLMRSVMHVRSCHGSAVHPTQKPTELIMPLVEYSCPGDGIVLDPFMGSGTTGVACMNLDRKFIGIEIEPKYFDIACERIEMAQKQTRLDFG